MARRRQRRRRVLHVAGPAAVAVAVWLTGCSADDGSTATDAATTTSAAPTSGEASTAAGSTTGSTEPPAHFPTPGDGCPTVEEVADVVGAPVEGGVSGGGHASTGVSWSSQGCSYTAVDGDGRVGIARLSLEEADTEGPTLFQLLDRERRSDAARKGFEPVEGLGDEAYRSGPRVGVRDGATVLLATSSDPDGEPDAAGSRRLAELALDADPSGGPAEWCDEVADLVEDGIGPVDRSVRRMGSSPDGSSRAGCAVMLEDGSEADVELADSASWDAWVAESRQGAVIYRTTSIGEWAAFDDGTALYVDETDQPLRVTTEDLDLGPEEAAQLREDLAGLALGI